jgi:hypothetical protein
MDGVLFARLDGRLTMRCLSLMLFSCCLLVACSKSSQPSSLDSGQADALVAPPDSADSRVSDEPQPAGPDLASDAGVRDSVALGPEVSTAADSPVEPSGSADAARDSSADGTTATRDAAVPPEVGRESGGEAGATGGSSGHVSVLEHHNHFSRDGFYVDRALSRTAVAGLHMDPTFVNRCLLLTGRVLIRDR